MAVIESDRVLGYGVDRENWDSLAATYERDLLEIVCGEGGGTLEEELAALADPSRRVADLGCGPGSLLPFLVERFGEVIAVDYAQELLEVARRRCRSRKVEFHCHDLSNGKDLPFKVEVACCVNALIDPDRGKRTRMARAVASSLVPKGAAVIVVPALESVFHVYHTLERIRQREGGSAGFTEKQADRMLRQEVDSFAGGIIRVGGILTKYWMREELVALLADHGLSPRRVRKVEYGWREEIDHPPAWLKGAMPWDWLVVAEKE